MARQNINLGTDPNDGEGDNLRTAFDKVNDNFIEVYTAGPVGSNIVISGNVIAANVTNANIELSPNGTGKVVIKNDLLPDANNTRYLGSTDSRFRGIYVGSAGVNTSGDLTVGNILPAANVTYNLGSPTAQWQTLYVSGNTIYLDGQPLRVSGNTLSVNGGNVVLDADITGYATESYVDSAIGNVIGGAPGALDTLNELAAALNDDASFNATITNSLANKANVSDIPTHTSNLTNDSGFITGYTVTSNDVTQHQGNITAGNSILLNGLNSSQFLRADQNDITTADLSIRGNAFVGPSADLEFRVDGLGGTSITSSGSLEFKNNTGNAIATWLTLDQETSNVIVGTNLDSYGNIRVPFGDDIIVTNGNISALHGNIVSFSNDGNVEIYNGSITAAGNITASTGTVTANSFVGNLTGTASSATTASLASAISIISTTGTDQEFSVLFASGSGNHTPRVDPTKLTFNPSSDTLSVNSATVTSTKIGQWDTAYGWGNHASAGYVESDTTGITGADQVTNMVSLTQAEYDAITPNASTVYIIVG